MEDPFRDINEWRQQKWEAAYAGNDLADCVKAWVAHKGGCLLSWKVNTISIVGGGSGFVLCACTLGALKVVVFALSLGNWKPEFSSGCVASLTLAGHGATGFFGAASEVIYDVGYLAYQISLGIRYVAKQLRLTGALKALVKKIIHCLSHIVSFLIGRIIKGFEIAAKHEPKLSIDSKLPCPLHQVNEAAEQYRIDTNKERTFGTIASHYVVSIPNILCSGIAATVGVVASAVLGTLFMVKAVLGATTNISIPIPTYAGHVSTFTLGTGYNAIADVANDIADIFVTMFKISEAIGVAKAVVTVGRVIAYIPEAVFS